MSFHRASKVVKNTKSMWALSHIETPKRNIIADTPTKTKSKSTDNDTCHGNQTEHETRLAQQLWQLRRIAR